MLERNVTEQSEINTPLQRDPKPDPINIERDRRDLILDMSERRMGDGGLSLVAVAIVVILAIVFFGINGRNTETAPPQTIPLAAR